MFKNMKLAAKIGVGFCLLILITVVLGGIATFCMLSVKTVSQNLVNREVPELAIANNVERSALHTM